MQGRGGFSLRALQRQCFQYEGAEPSSIVTIAIVAAWSEDVGNVFDLHAHLALARTGSLPVQH